MNDVAPVELVGLLCFNDGKGLALRLDDGTRVTVGYRSDALLRYLDRRVTITGRFDRNGVLRIDAIAPCPPRGS
jgi:hypothetical protein